MIPDEIVTAMAKTMVRPGLYGCFEDQEQLPDSAGWKHPPGTPNKYALETIRRALKAAEAAGFVLVPKEATLDMSIAFAEVYFAKRRGCDDDDISDWWSAMLAAAPTVGD